VTIVKVSFENFLQFWAVHNRQIIEFVFVSTFIIILFVIYRQFFAKSESTEAAGSHGTPVSIDTTEIEEKLKKILENQSAFKTVASENASTSPVASAEGAAVVAAVDTQELEKLRSEVKQKEQAIEELKKASAASAAGSASVGKEDTKKFEDKIKELEGRLQEYEIISEDIADLSFYKEENARLQKELSAKGGVAAPAAEPAAAPVIAAPVEVPAVAPVEAPTVAPESDAVAAAAAAEMAPTPVEAAAPVDSVIDDDILKEFAAAVEGQKATEKEKKDAKAAPDAPAADPAQPIDPQKLTESKELMGEFENFIKKG